MSKAALAGALLALMCGTWYWTLVPPAASAPPARGPASRQSRAAAAVPAVRLERLATAAPVAPTVGGRDPFTSAAASSPPAGAEESGGAARQAASRPTADTTAPIWPRIELIGIAEANDAATLVRTAIVSGPRGVHHVRVGDVVEAVYRVERIDAEAIDVRLVPEDRLIRLALRR